MKLSVKIFIGVYLILFAAGGCIGLNQTERRIDHYTLEYDPPRIAGPARLPVALRVERFQAAPFYNSDNMIYREKSFKRDAYAYHKWRAAPADLVTYFLTRDLKASSLFKAIFTFGSRMPSTHVLEGTVDEFFEQDENNFWEAVLSVSVSLLTEQDPDIAKRVLFQKRYGAREACDQKNPRALAQAMSKALSKVSELMITDIYHQLNN